MRNTSFAIGAKARWAAFLADEGGATAIEYAMIASGIAMTILASLITAGETVRDDLFAPVQNGFTGN